MKKQWLGKYENIDPKNIDYHVKRKTKQKWSLKEVLTMML